MSIQKVLVIGYVWPEPNSSAAGWHMLSILKLLKAQGWQVTFATPAQRTDHMYSLANDDIDSIEIELNNESFDRFVTELSPDIVVFDRFMMEEQFGWRVEKNCPNAIRVLDTEDLQCLRNARQLALKQDRKFNESDLLDNDLAIREIAAIYRCDLSLIISSFEFQLLRNQFQIPESHLINLPFMLSTSELTVDKKPFVDRNHFVAIGNFRHAPNWDSVIYLQKIWPRIRERLPQAELHIYGAYPPKKATQLNNPKAGFLIKGWAEDALSVMRNAKVCLAPLRFGAGIKGKLLDAMRCGTPSVTTDIGAEGMADDMPWPGEIANDIESIVDGAVRLFENQTEWQHAYENIIPLLTKNYDMDYHGKQLIRKLELIAADKTSHRQQNFIGKMLNHHSMKSTMFMSRWIEAKNKLS